MGKKNKNIIIWALTWAVLFLVLAYSPIGRPDLYVGNSYYISSQGGVNFKTGISNAPKGTGFTSTPDNNNDEVPSYNPSTINSNSTFSGNASKYSSSSFSNSSAPISSSYEQSSSNSAGNFVPMGYGSSNKQAAQGSATAQNNVSTLTAYGSLSSMNNRQSTNHNNPQETGNGYGGVNEGDDPTGPPIPVGDGLWVLLFMTAMYVIWKQRQTKKLETTHK